MELVKNGKSLLDAKYSQVKIEFNKEHGVLWTQLNQTGVPCMTLPLLKELQHHNAAIESSGGILSVNDEPHRIQYSVSASLNPGVFSLGGQLSLFRELIRSRNRDALMHYGRECVLTQLSRINRFYLPLTTLALVEGDALGGGFEGVLVCDVIIAEQGCQMGFPEILFNLFPGMGAYNLLARKVGTALAEKLILSGKMYSSEELYEMGVVDVLAEKGRGRDAIFEYVRRQEKRSNGFQAVQRVRQKYNPVTYQELMDVIHIWVDAALNLNERDLKVMDRFVRSQERMFLTKPVVQEQEYLIA